MKKKRLLTGILSASLLLAPVNVFASINTNNMDESTETVVQSNQVSELDAQNALQNFLIQNNLSDAHKKVVLQEYLYDVDESVIAYYFTVQGDNGYYIVSADYTLNPINEYSEDGEFPVSFEDKGNLKPYYVGVGSVVFAKNSADLQEKYKAKKEKRQKLLKEEKIKVEKVKQENVQKQKDIKALISSLNNNDSKKIDQNKKNLQEVEKQIETANVVLPSIAEELKELETNNLTPFQKNKQKSKYWSELLDADPKTANETSFKATSTVSAAASSYERELPVDRFWQQNPYVGNPISACAPTTGAMIMDFYHDARGFNIRDNEYYGGSSADESVGRLINHLYWDMGTGATGTSLSLIAYGMREHIMETATSNWSAVQVKDPHLNSYNASLKYRSSINNQHPAAIRFDFFSTNPNLDYHVVAGNGWILSGTNHDNLLVRYKDPDNGQYNTSTRTFDWSNNDEDMEFVYMTF